MRFELAHQHDDVHRGEARGQFLFGARRDSFDKDTIGNAKTVRQLVKLSLVRAAAGDPEPCVGTTVRMAGNASITRWCPLYSLQPPDGSDLQTTGARPFRFRRRGEFRPVGNQREAGGRQPEEASVMLDLEAGDGNETARAREQRPEREKLGGTDARSDPRRMPSTVKGQDEGVFALRAPAIASGATNVWYDWTWTMSHSPRVIAL